MLVVSLNRIIKLCVSSSHYEIVRGSKKAVLCLECGCIRYIACALGLRLNTLLLHVLYSTLSDRALSSLISTSQIPAVILLLSSQYCHDCSVFLTDNVKIRWLGLKPVHTEKLMIFPGYPLKAKLLSLPVFSVTCQLGEMGWYTCCHNPRKNNRDIILRGLEPDAHSKINSFPGVVFTTFLL